MKFVQALQSEGIHPGCDTFNTVVRMFDKISKARVEEMHTFGILSDTEWLQNFDAAHARQQATLREQFPEAFRGENS